MPFFGGLNNYRIRGTNNMAGTSAGQNLSTGLRNLLLGNQAGFSVIAGTQNVLAGIGAGSTEELSNVVGVGYGVVFGAGANGAVAVGNQANAGPESVVIGDEAGFGATGDPGGNVLIGHLAGFESLATATRTVLVGGQTYAGANDVVIVGDMSAAGATGSVAIGSGASVDVTAGVGSIAIGRGTTSQVGVVIGPGLNNFVGLQTVAIGENLTLGAVGSTVVIGSLLDSAVETEYGAVIVGAGDANPLIYAPLGGMTLPVGTTAERSLDDLNPRLRFNRDLSEPEVFDPETDLDWRTVVTAIPGAAGAAVGTLTNAPAAGNPIAWLSVRVGGVDYRIPAWAG
jgi:hypothetical protein